MLAGAAAALSLKILLFYTESTDTGNVHVNVANKKLKYRVCRLHDIQGLHAEDRTCNQTENE